MSNDWSTVPVRGFRRWRFESDGTLVGIAYALPWTPGVNEAICPLVTSYLDPQTGNVVEKPYKSEPHPLKGCSHGFYARYTTMDNNSYYPVTGMIEAWGEVIAGPDGFRAEKAKIVALMLPDLPKPPPRSKKWLWFGRKHYEIPDLGLDWLPTKVIDDDYNQRVRDRYPDVPVFSTVDAMLEEFPIDQGEYPVKREKAEKMMGQVIVPRGGITYTSHGGRGSGKSMSAATHSRFLRVCGACGGGGCTRCGGKGMIPA